MTHKHYIWKGPSTGIEVWSEGAAEPKLIFSGQVAPGKPIDTALPADHSQVVGWLAFRLIEEAPETKEQAGKEQATVSTTGEPTKKKERTDG